MSNFRSKAFNPASKRVEVAEYCDDYYGRHRYGIRFDDGCVHPEAQCGIDAAATQLDALQARVKELDGRYLGAVAARGMLRDRADEAESRATRLQQERDEARRCAIKAEDDCDNLVRDRERLQQERDEAYERAAVKVRDVLCCMDWPPSNGDELIDTLQAAIRRLAGPEKDGK